MFLGKFFSLSVRACRYACWYYYPLGDAQLLVFSAAELLVYIADGRL